MVVALCAHIHAQVLGRKRLGQQLAQRADLVALAEGPDDVLHPVVAEAERRGLLNLRTTADAMHAFATEKNVALFKNFGVYNHSEVVSRKDILLENYTKLIAIEANTMIDMARTQIIPAGFRYGEALADYAMKKKELGVKGLAETDLLRRVSALTDEIAAKTEALEQAMIGLYDNEHPSYYCRDTVIPAMNELRAAAGQLEPLTAKEYQPFPTYADLLYSV